MLGIEHWAPEKELTGTGTYGWVGCGGKFSLVVPSSPNVFSGHAGEKAYAVVSKSGMTILSEFFCCEKSF